MFGAKLTRTPLYRWRYQIGYTAFVLVLAGVLLGAGFVIPGSLSPSELSSLITTANTNLEALLSASPINLPYHLLQHVTLSLFSVTILGIKLPSLLLGLLAAVALIFLLRRWYASSIAILSTIIMITTGQFIFLAQQGSPGILYIFWPAVILLFATLSASQAKLRYLWLVLGFAAAALSLYTPLSVYILLALFSAILLHPHLRFLLQKIPTNFVIVAALLASLILAPLVWMVIQDPSYGLVLLGIPDSVPDLIVNVKDLLMQYFGFAAVSSSSLLLPLFSLSSMMIIIYGIWLIRRKLSTVQGYIIVSWTLLLLVPLVLNPSHTSIMFIPMTLLFANGLQGLLSRWYSIFPFNPYARVAGLISLTLLISIMVLFGLERYSYSYRYAPTVVQNFSRDVLIIPKTNTLLVTSDELLLYKSVERYRPDLNVTQKPPLEGDFATTAKARRDRTPSSIVVSPSAEDAVRFYLYQ